MFNLIINLKVSKQTRSEASKNNAVISNISINQVNLGK